MLSPKIENPGSSDDYVDGLRCNLHTPYSVYDSDNRSLSETSEHNSDSDKGVARSGRFMLRLFGIAVVFISGAIVGSHHTQPAVSNTANEPHATTVTVTKPATVMPVACKKALASVEKYFNQAAAITSVNGQQLDIFSEAYQAIMKRDWKRIHELTEEQLKLERSLSDPTFQLMPNLADIKKDLDECQSQSN